MSESSQQLQGQKRYNLSWLLFAVSAVFWVLNRYRSSNIAMAGYAFTSVIAFPGLFILLGQEAKRQSDKREKLIASEESQLAAYEADTDRVEQFLALAKKYRDFTELTTPMINEFIDRILVHAPTKDEYGDRCQEVEIYLNFIGRFEVPTPEPTPEELAQQEAERKKRAANREKYYRRKERKAKEAAEAAAAALAEAELPATTE